MVCTMPMIYKKNLREGEAYSYERRWTPDGKAIVVIDGVRLHCVHEPKTAGRGYSPFKFYRCKDAQGKDLFTASKDLLIFLNWAKAYVDKGGAGNTEESWQKAARTSV